MNIYHLLFVLSIGYIIRSNNVESSTIGKAFEFTGDQNLKTAEPKPIIDESKIVDRKKIEEEQKEEIKDMVSEINETIYKEKHLENLPINDYTEEDVESARENGSFLSDKIEEASNNFSNTTTTEEVDETEEKNIKKYQAEVINSMNKENNVYESMETEHMEHEEEEVKEEEENDENCVRDYSLPCPIDFFRTSSGCVPLNSYKGSCNKLQDKLYLLKEEQKKSWEELCESRWPCISKECLVGTDYTTNCPINFIEIKNSNTNQIICKKDIHFQIKSKKEHSNNKDSICNKNEINATNMNENDKKKLEILCNFRYRCKTPIYIEDFHSDCPKDWISIGSNKCQSPDDYEGPCPKVSNLKKYNTEELKKQIEIACLVNWPYEIISEKYDRDYNSVCPIFWYQINENSDVCKAPENYSESNENCKKEMSFSNMNDIEKLSYSIECHVDFPFKNKEDCNKDYSFDCPLNWIPLNKKGYCKAPLNYKSKICKNISKFTNLKENHIQFYKKSCNIQWPCEREIQNSLIYTKKSINFPQGSIRTAKGGPIHPETGSIV